MRHHISYFRSGYQSACKHFDPSDLDVKVQDRSYMVTGANSGVGKSTALAIAKKGIFYLIYIGEHSLTQFLDRSLMIG